jgi:hypothetical protein
MASSARGSRCAGRRKSRQRWIAKSGLAVCHVWTGKADGVGGSPILHRKDCLNNWYSSLQSITSGFRKMAETPLQAVSAICKTRSERKGLIEALAYLRPGDTFVVWKLDRAGRSLTHL